MTAKKYILLFVVMAFVTCISVSCHIEKLQAVRLSWEAPFLDPERDTIIKMNGSGNLFFYNDITLYEKEGIFIHADDTQEKVYTYWMYRQNQKKGVRYKRSYRDTIGSTFDVDSFLVKNAFKNFPFYSKENDSLVFKGTDNKRMLVEKYIPKTKPDDSYPDTVVFKFSKGFEDIPFSLSSELDERTKGKLVEVTNTYNAVPNSKSKAQSKSRSMLFRLERISTEQQEDKMKYFERFEKRTENKK